MSFPIRSLLLAALLSLLALPVLAGNAGRGQEKSIVCQGCHGVDGNGIPGEVGLTYPIIAGQYADYLAFSLRQYRSRARVSDLMYGIAQTLSDADIDDLAAFYSQQQSPKLRDLREMN